MEYKQNSRSQATNLRYDQVALRKESKMSSFRTFRVPADSIMIHDHEEMALIEKNQLPIVGFVIPRGTYKMLQDLKHRSSKRRAVQAPRRNNPPFFQEGNSPRNDDQFSNSPPLPALEPQHSSEWDANLQGRQPSVTPSLKRHELGTSIYDCDIPIFSYDPMHRRDVFSALRKHKCERCSKRFQSSSELRRHYRVHTGERPFMCDVCGSRFKQKSHLKVHGQTHFKYNGANLEKKMQSNVNKSVSRSPSKKRKLETRV